MSNEEQLSQQIEAFLQAGGKIEEVPGFNGQPQPKRTEVNLDFNYGLKRGPDPFQPRDTNALIARYQAGTSLRALAYEYRVARETMRSFLKTCNVPIAPPGRRKGIRA